MLQKSIGALPDLFELMHKDAGLFPVLVLSNCLVLQIALLLVPFGKQVFFIDSQEAFNSEVNRLLCVLPRVDFSIVIQRDRLAKQPVKEDLATQVH